MMYQDKENVCVWTVNADMFIDVHEHICSTKLIESVSS